MIYFTCHPLRVSLARARSLFRPLLPSACYAGYVIVIVRFNGTLFSAEAALCRREAGEREKRRARDDGKGKERKRGFCLSPLPIVPHALIAVYTWIPSGSLWGRREQQDNQREGGTQRECKDPRGKGA